MVLRHNVSQCCAHGQCVGRCRMGRRRGRASRAGMLTMRRRRVDPRALAWVAPARTSAARSRLWAIALLVGEDYEVLADATGPHSRSNNSAAASAASAGLAHDRISSVGLPCGTSLAHTVIALPEVLGQPAVARFWPLVDDTGWPQRWPIGRPCPARPAQAACSPALRQREAV